MTTNIWTNSGIRRHLGERGFIEEQDTHIFSGDLTISYWTRLDETVALEEYTNGDPPVLSFNDKEINPAEIGFININIQNQALGESH